MGCLTLDVLYFGRFSPFKYSPLPLYLPHPVYQQFSIYNLISSNFTSYGMQYYRCSIILFYFPSFLKFRRVVPLLQSCSTFEFIYNYVCLYIYIYIYIHTLILFLDLTSMYARKRVFCVSDPG
jgi:hypothetical protein